MDGDARKSYGELADRLEAELRRLGAWDAPAPAGPATSAFGTLDRSFTQWVRYDLLPRLRDVAAGRADPPAESMVGAYAVRELDGVDEADKLIEVLLELDRLVEGGRH